MVHRRRLAVAATPERRDEEELRDVLDLGQRHHETDHFYVLFIQSLDESRNRGLAFHVRPAFQRVEFQLLIPGIRVRRQRRRGVRHPQLCLLSLQKLLLKHTGQPWQQEQTYHCGTHTE